MLPWLECSNANAVLIMIEALKNITNGRHKGKLFEADGFGSKDYNFAVDTVYFTNQLLPAVAFRDIFDFLRDLVNFPL